MQLKFTFKLLQSFLTLVLICFGENAFSQGKVSRLPQQQSQPSKPKKIAPQVTVSEPDEYINGHGYIDLGLPSGTKWATCNIGAIMPEVYGDYFAWGEKSTKSVYNDNNAHTYGVEVGDIGGSLQYDAATIIWGKEWRIPSNNQCQELVDECTWMWGNLNGKNGYKVVGPNNKAIFLPAAGERFGSKLNDIGSLGGYWSSTPDPTEPRHALHFFFNKNNVSDVIWWNRFAGASIRPVLE